MKHIRRKGLGVRSQDKSLRPSHLTPHALRLTSSQRSQLVLVIGGAESGKSAAALDLAGESAKRAFVATGGPPGKETAGKNLPPRARRRGARHTHEVPSHL